MKIHTHTTRTYIHTLKNGTEIELELPVKPSFIMDFKDVLSLETDTLTIGYLADDRDCSNPFEDSEGMGAIYECRRHSKTLADYERALGLNDGDRNLDLVDEDDVVERALEMILADVNATYTALTHCENHWMRQDGEPDDDFIRRCLDSENELCPVIDTDAIRTTLWQEGREAGTIGDKHAVLLDVYEHGLVSYGVSGGGMQCQFDTARAGAVWVPDDYAREEIISRAAVYRKGDVNDSGRAGQITRFTVGTLREDLLGYDRREHPTFEHWYDAYQYLKTIEVDHQRDQRTAEGIAAEELAKQAAKTYTDWANGNCFGIVIAHYKLTGGECIEEDTCWGFIGDDYAYDSLKNDYFKEPA